MSVEDLDVVLGLLGGHGASTASRVGCLLESFGCLQRSRAERCDSACGIDILDFPKASRVLIDSGACSQGGQPKKLTMNTLPDDLLCRCLARVPLADRVPAERVCKAWREACASKAYTVARGACAEPVWLVMGGRDGTSRVLDQCHMLDSSLRKVAQLAPRHSASAGSAVIPGLGLLVMGGHGADHQHTRTARVLNLQGGSVWGVWGLLPDSCSKPSICALGESIYVDCCYNIHSDDAESELLRYDKQGNLLETIQKPAAIRRPLGDAPVLCAFNGRLFLMTRVTLLEVVPVIYRMDSYDPATGAWQRMPDPPIQGFGLNN